MNIRIYTRVSRDEQADSRLGLEAQEAACRTFAPVKLGTDSIQVYKENENGKGVSGKMEIDKRPALKQLLMEIRRGDVLLVAKRDRVAREPGIIAIVEYELARKKARLVSVAGEGTEFEPNEISGVYLRAITDAGAKVERLQTAKRTKAALYALKERGMQFGTIPYGYRRGKQVTIRRKGQDVVRFEIETNEEEQKIIELVLAWRLQGYTFDAIVSDLNKEGFRNRAGKKWEYRSVWNIARAAKARE